MSWVWPEYINHALPLTADQRRAIHRDAWRLWWANKWNVALYLTVPASYLLGIPFAKDVGGGIAALLGAPGYVYSLCRAAGPLLLFVLCFVLGGAVLQRFRFAPCVYQATRRQGHDVCARCGYWLRGLGEQVQCCPECGNRRRAQPAKEPHITNSD